MQRSQKILFFGTEDFSVLALEQLIAAGFLVAAVITKPDSKKGRGQKTTAPRVKTVAEKYNIPVWQPTKLVDIMADVQSMQPVAGVLVSYGKIIPQAIIDLFAPGIINVHPSLLPAYRGPSPIESAIRNGDTKTGVSIMQLSASMDAGPIYGHQTHQLTGHETRPGLYQLLGEHGAELLTTLLPDILAGALVPTPQEDDQATYCQLLKKDNAWVQPAQQSAIDIERHVRAHLGFPRTKLHVLDTDIIITKAHVSHTKNTPLDIECQDGAYLSIDELIAPSGKTMPASAFLNGYTAES